MATGRQASTTAIEPVILGRPVSNGVAREQVADIQRARMLTAMVDEISERGATNVSVAHVVGRSGVSRRTFYEIFTDREDCFLAAFDEGIEQVSKPVLAAYERPGRWREKIRTALIALLEFLDQEPTTARLLIVESLGAGPVALERRQRVFAHLVSAIDEGHKEAKAGFDPSSLTAEGVVGGVLSVLHARIAEREKGALVELTSSLVGMILLPYLGPTIARNETERPTPKGHDEKPTAHRDPLRDLQMRLTYRTVRVLIAVAANPGSSNRTVGDAAGIADQGQISKLLARLHGLGLIQNTGAGSARGEPNAWTLTTTGWEVHNTIAQQTISV